MKKLWHSVAAFLAAFGALLGASPATGAQWPERPVTLVVAYPPGGSVDLIGRILSDELSKKFDASFVVANRPGAAGLIGTQYVAGQPADGYTFLVSATGHVMAPAIQPDVRYDPLKSFEPIALLGSMPNFLLVTPGLAPANMAEFMEWAKSQESINYASSGVGGANHLSGEFFRHATGLPMVHTPYKGAAPALADVMAGHVPVAVLDAASASSVVKEGKVRALAVTTAKRSPAHPDVPPIADYGVPGFDFSNWVAMHAPAGTSEQIVKRMNEAVLEILASPDVKARIEGVGMDVGTLDEKAFRAFIESETAKWADAVRETGIKISN